MSSALPVDIDQDETVLRSLRRTDLNNALTAIRPGSLKPQRAGNGKLSFIRERIGLIESRASAITYVHGDLFRGFGLVKTNTLLGYVESISDDRNHFVGHADAALGFEIPLGPPNTPANMDDVYENAMKRLLAFSGAFSIQLDYQSAA